MPIFYDKENMVWNVLMRIAEKHNVEVRIEDFDSETTELFGGFCVTTTKGIVILINKDVPEMERANILAHELGHYKLHPNIDMAAYKNNERYYSLIEQEANRFGKKLFNLIWRREVLPIIEARDREFRRREAEEQAREKKKMDKTMKRIFHLLQHPEDATQKEKLIMKELWEQTREFQESFRRQQAENSHVPSRGWVEAA